MKNSISSDIASLELKALQFKLCSVAFLYPDGAWKERMDRFAGKTGEAGQSFLSTPANADLANLQTRHFRLFGPNPSSPLELAHHLSENPFERVKIQAHMAGFYKAFGVEFSEGSAPDHLSVGLEFLAYLALKEAHALNKNLGQALEITRKAFKNYVSEFFLPGLKKFNQKLSDCEDKDSFYIILTALVLKNITH